MMPRSVSVSVDRLERVGRELDVAQHVGDVFRQQLTIGTAANDQDLPFRSVDPLRR